MGERWDCVVVGGGPAGLMAAIYLARFRLSVLVMDAGGGRARSIPRTRNAPGFPDGIAGSDLVDRMRTQAKTYGARLERGFVDRLRNTKEGFTASCGSRLLSARTVLLATGVTNRSPPTLDAQAHDAALAAGLVRYCPICDGYEVSDKRVLVLGTGEHALREAEFLRSYTKDVTLAGSNGDPLSDEALLERARQASIAVVAGPCRRINTRRDCVEVDLPVGHRRFDTLYPALGSIVRSELAVAVGATVTDEGCILVDRHQRTSVRQLYAAGDVVLGLDQLSHAMGEGGVAATTIRNDLAGLRCLWR